MLMLTVDQIVCHPQACSIVMAKSQIGDDISEAMIGVVVKYAKEGIAVFFENGETVEFDTSKTWAHFDFFVAITDRYIPMPQDKNGILCPKNLFDSGALDAALYQTHGTDQAVHNKSAPRH